MKKLLLAVLLTGIFSAAIVQAQCTPGEKVTGVSAMIDLGKAKIGVNGKSLRYVLGTRQAKAARLNPPGKVSIIVADGYLLRVGDGETVFVITKIEV
ncbi:MAG: hypothetical protein ABL958_16945, partial [Bdellovibrionia bacterium]